MPLEITSSSQGLVAVETCSGRIFWRFRNWIAPVSLQTFEGVFTRKFLSTAGAFYVRAEVLADTSNVLKSEIVNVFLILANLQKSI